MHPTFCLVNITSIPFVKRSPPLLQYFSTLYSAPPSSTPTHIHLKNDKQWSGPRSSDTISKLLNQEMSFILVANTTDIVRIFLIDQAKKTTTLNRYPLNNQILWILEAWRTICPFCLKRMGHTGHWNWGSLLHSSLTWRLRVILCL